MLKQTKEKKRQNELERDGREENDDVIEREEFVNFNIFKVYLQK